MVTSSPATKSGWIILHSLKLLIFYALFISGTFGNQVNILDSEGRTINSAKYDNRGILWVATDEGLIAKANQSSFFFSSEITDSNSIIDSEITKLAKTYDGNIVALSESGLSFFEPSEFNFKQLRLNSKPVGFYYDHVEKNYWVLTEKSGVTIVDPDGNLIRVLKTDTLNPNSISSLRFDNADENALHFTNDKYVYIATDKGFNIYNRKSKTIQRRLAKLLIKIKSIQEINDKFLLLASENRIDLFDTKNQKFVGKERLVNEDGLWDGGKISSVHKVGALEFVIKTDKEFKFLTQDPISENNLISGTIQSTSNSDFITSVQDAANPQVRSMSETLLILSGKNLFEVRGQGDIRRLVTMQTDIVDVSETKNGYLITTSDQLVHVYTSNQVIRNELNSGILFYGSKKDIQLAINDNTIKIRGASRQNWEKIKIPNEIELTQNAHFDYGNNYVAMIEDRQLSIFSVKKRIFVLQALPISDYKVSSFDNIKIVENLLFLSTGNGILRFTLPTDTNFSFQDQLLSSRTYFEFNALLNDKIPRAFFDIVKVHNEFWISSADFGLSIHKEDLNKRVKDFTYKPGDNSTLASGAPYRIVSSHSKPNGKIFIGTRGQGLFSYSLLEKDFTQYDTDDGLLSNNIRDLAIDSKGTLWIQSNDGLNSLSKEGLKTISQQNGLRVKIPHKRSIHEVDRRIFVTGRDISQSFDPEKAIGTDGKLVVHIARIQGLNSENTRSNLPIPTDGNLSFDHNITSLIFDVFVNKQTNANLVRYFYTIGKRDIEIPNGRNNTIQISDIPFYQSNINIFAINANGQRTANTIEISLNRRPPEWMRYEMIFFYLVLITGALIIIVKRREQYQLRAAESRRHESELDEARRLQESLLPKENPSNQALDISTFMRPATEVGGDYYDFYETGGGLYAVCGDATGHGVISGIMVSVTKAGLLGIPLTNPSEILRKLNKIVKQVNFGRVRMSLTITKITSEKLTISSAAMPPLYLFRSATGKVEEMLVPNLPLGGLESENYESFDVAFNVDDVLVMISDGLAELPNKNGELLEYGRISSCILENAEKRSKQIKAALVGLADQWSDGLSNPDDITVLVIKKNSIL